MKKAELSQLNASIYTFHNTNQQNLVIPNHVHRCNIYELFLKKLEARIKVLILHQHLAKDLKNKKMSFSVDQQINALFIEYRLEGGTNMFYGPNHNGFE